MDSRILKSLGKAKRFLPDIGVYYDFQVGNFIRMHWNPSLISPENEH